MFTVVRQVISRKNVRSIVCKESQLKRIMFLLPLLAGVATVCVEEKKIILESSVVKIADGAFINADKIEFIRKFRRTLLSFLLGDQQSNNQRRGKYLFGSKL